MVCNSNINVVEEEVNITFVEFRLQKDKEILKKLEVFWKTKKYKIWPWIKNEIHYNIIDYILSVFHLHNLLFFLYLEACTS